MNGTAQDTLVLLLHACTADPHTLLCAPPTATGPGLRFAQTGLCVKLFAPVLPQET